MPRTSSPPTTTGTADQTTGADTGTGTNEKTTATVTATRQILEEKQERFYSRDRE